MTWKLGLSLKKVHNESYIWKTILFNKKSSKVRYLSNCKVIFFDMKEIIGLHTRDKQMYFYHQILLRNTIFYCTTLLCVQWLLPFFSCTFFKLVHNVSSNINFPFFMQGYKVCLCMDVSIDGRRTLFHLFYIWNQ